MAPFYLEVKTSILWLGRHRFSHRPGNRFDGVRDRVLVLSASRERRRGLILGIVQRLQGGVTLGEGGRQVRD